MGIRADINDAWAAGAGSPTKYEFSMSSEIDVVQDGDEADFTWHGTLTVTNYPNNSRNGFPASDFATWSVGDDNFSRGGEINDYHYGATMPYTGNGLPTDKILVQFQGRTWRGGGANTTTVYNRGAGIVLPQSGAAGTRTYNFSIPFHLHLTEEPEQIVVFYNGSGANNGMNASWFRNEVYIYVRQFMDAGLITFDYRPGERKVQGVWQSHNRENGGVCERKNGGWYEMRTRQGDKNAKGDPPERKHDNDWYNMHKIGANAG